MGVGKISQEENEEGWKQKPGMYNCLRNNEAGEVIKEAKNE